jgi:hypothetical protein
MLRQKEGMGWKGRGLAAVGFLEHLCVVGYSSVVVEGACIRYCRGMESCTVGIIS